MSTPETKTGTVFGGLYAPDAARVGGSGLGIALMSFFGEKEGR